MCVVKLYLNKDLVNCPIERLTVVAGCEHLQVVNFLSVSIYIILEYLIIDEDLVDILQICKRYKKLVIEVFGRKSGEENYFVSLL